MENTSSSYVTASLSVSAGTSRSVGRLSVAPGKVMLARGSKNNNMQRSAAKNRYIVCILCIIILSFFDKDNFEKNIVNHVYGTKFA
jgi:hypothetical protein